MKKIICIGITITILGCILAVIHIINNNTATPFDNVDFQSKIQEICLKHGYEPQNEYYNDDGEYKEYCCLVNLEDSGYVLQVDIGDPYVRGGWLILSISKEVDEIKDAQAEFLNYSDLLIDIINAFNKKEISNTNIINYFEDENNIIKKDWYDEDSDMYYTIKREGYVKDCVATYYVWCDTNVINKVASVRESIEENFEIMVNLY